MTIDQTDFRNALGTFATGVTIVTTTSDDGDPIGLTANSFSSVSLSPPLILFCLDRGSFSFAHFERSSHFAVNVLSAEQQDVSNHFARPSEDKWNDISFSTGKVGCPAFSEALAIFECSTDSIHDAGDHIIIVGKVEHFELKPEGEPLLYYKGRYAKIAAEA
jgi:flavin reductase (DIM6/NTAB) family NADH-FMN oxidoreductase RutF